MSNELVTTQPTDFAAMLAVAEQLVPTGFLPAHIKTAGQALAIILAGQELGMTTMLALRSITIIKGKVVVNADAQLGLFKARGGRAVFRTLTDSVAILDLTHPNGDTHTETFTMEDAKRAHLTGNPTWSQYPKAMLRSRVITAGLKSVGFEPTAGAYDPEEAAAFTEIPQSTSVPMPPPGLVQAALTSGEAEDDGADSPTRDTPFPRGMLKGKTVREMANVQLEWGIVEGRNLGGDTDAWQQVMKAELESRQPFSLAVTQASEREELAEKIGVEV